MSKQKKSKKLRRPNIPAAAVEARGGGQERAPKTASAKSRATAQDSAAGRPAETGRTNFDYTYVIQDLRRIGLLAGGFIVILVVLAFVIR